MSTLQSRYEAAIRETQAAGELALKWFDTDVAVETKDDASPVTIADRSAEAQLRERLGKLFPTDGFLGEEFGETLGTSGYRWVFDPIDGTRSFIRGIPIWGTLVAVEYQGEPVIGITYMPAMKTMYRAMKSDGAYRDDRRIQVSKCENIGEALLSYSSWSFFQKTGTTETFLRLLGATERSRSYSDFYGFMLLAQGSVEVMIDTGVHRWDVAPLKVIVEEAGGRFCNWDGACDLDKPDVLATNGAIHEATLRVVRG